MAYKTKLIKKIRLKFFQFKIGYYLLQVYSELNKKIFKLLLPFIFQKKSNLKLDNFDLFYYSSEKDVWELIASILSFLKFFGKPRSIIVISDGSITRKSKKIILKIDKIINVKNWNEYIPSHSLPKSILKFSQRHPLGKKFALLYKLMNKEEENICYIYSDSDIFFFPEGSKYLKKLKKSINYYLEDCIPFFDDRIFNYDKSEISPVNSGFLIINKPIKFSESLNILESFNEAPNHFTEQTLINIECHLHKFEKLNPKKWILQIDDEFRFSDPHANQNIALRHYVQISETNFGKMLKLCFNFSYTKIFQ